MAKCIIISGIDGSGKSTIINEAIKYFESEGKRVGYVWLRMNHYLTKCMHALARVCGLSVKVKNELGVVWQHRFYNNQLFCSVYIFMVYLDSWISRLKYNKVARGKDLVICDRWIMDILVDLAVKTRRNSFFYTKWPKLFMNILPKGCQVFIVVRNVESLKECRLENRIDPDFKYRLKLYEDLCESVFLTVIDNNGTIENSIEQIKTFL